jgi:hypothetical protein
MKLTTEKILTKTITLNETEADWLKSVMQNPVNGDPDPDNEDLHDKQMRMSFWDALSDK